MKFFLFCFPVTTQSWRRTSDAPTAHAPGRSEILAGSITIYKCGTGTPSTLLRLSWRMWTTQLTAMEKKMARQLATVTGEALVPAEIAATVVTPRPVAVSAVCRAATNSELCGPATVLLVWVTSPSLVVP